MAARRSLSTPASLTELTLAAAAAAATAAAAAATTAAAAAGRCLTELTLAVQKLSVTNARPPLDSNIFLHFSAELSGSICVVTKVVLHYLFFAFVL